MPSGQINLAIVVSNIVGYCYLLKAHLHKTMSELHSFCNSVHTNSYILLCYISVQTSGTTVTFVIIEGWVVTVASVGDSRCVLESAEGEIYYLSADHRLECNVEE